MEVYGGAAAAPAVACNEFAAGYGARSRVSSMTSSRPALISRYSALAGSVARRDVTWEVRCGEEEEMWERKREREWPGPGRVGGVH